VANTVSWSRLSEDAELVGESTDGAGFIDALRGDEGFDPAGRRVVVLGAGGAARAVTLALTAAGAGQVTVVARRVEPAISCAALAEAAGAGIAAGEVPALRAVISDAELVVNATPVGMDRAGEMPFGLEESWLSASQFVADLVYAPAVTPLLAAARRAGATGSNGLGMLIHQAGRQVELWTGRRAPLEAMSAAAIGVIELRRGAEPG
jgi:shikimate dehydrogenase